MYSVVVVVAKYVISILYHGPEAFLCNKVFIHSFNPRKLSPKKIKIQQELVDKMLEEVQIEHSVSAWSAPTVLVTKKDGTTRFCVDYRRLNARTKKDAFPLPLIDDSLNSLSGQAWFSTLDLASGYWEVRLSEEAKPKTAFATHGIIPICCNALRVVQRTSDI